MRRAFLLLLSLSACGGAERVETATRTADSQPTAAPTESDDMTDTEEVREAVASPEDAPPLDLLQSVATDIAVSSAYRGELTQVARLVDGDLETAWNSASDDLVGARIDVRIPAGATVTSIAMTAGFTHRTDRADLFTGNHRVMRVRVLRDGTLLGEHTLDPASRALQTLPVEGPGGVYRIEIAAVQPGSNAAWREACISELRVMGRAPEAAEDTRYPRFAIGDLPAPRGGASPDVAALGAAHRGEVRWLARTWAEHERDEHFFDNSTADCDDDPVRWNGAQRRRRTVLERVARFVDSVDPVASDVLRRRAAMMRGRPDCLVDDHRRHAERGADLDAIAAGLVAVGEQLDDAARCRWARAHAELRVLRLSQAATNAWYLIEYNFEFDIDQRPSEGRRQGQVEQMRDRLSGWRWPGRGEATIPRLRQLDRSALPNDAPDFDALGAQLDRADAVCASR